MNESNLQQLRILDTIKYACYDGKFNIIKYYVDKNEIPQSYLDDFLRYSCRHGYLNQVNYFIEKGANIHHESEYPLRVAVMENHLSIVKLLVEKGADIHVSYYKAGDDYPICLAAGRGHIAIVKYLVENGADYRACKDLAFKWALEKEHKNVIDFFFENSKKIPDKEDLAYNKGYAILEIGKFVVEHKMDLLPEKYKQLESCASKGYFETIKYLYKYPTELKHEDFLLNVAAFNGDEKIFQWIENPERSVYFSPVYDSVLYWAAGGGNLNIVKILVNRVTNIYRFNDDAKNFALRRKHYDIADFLTNLKEYR